MGSSSAHVDTFARDNLPPRHEWPEFLFDLAELRYPARVNCATVLLDDAIAEGHGDRVALYSANGNWTYRQLLACANQISHVLIGDLGLMPGHRVLLRAPNNPMLAACWLAVMKAGGIAVTTMPMLRAKELSVIAEKARISHALCDERLTDELRSAATATGLLSRVMTFGGGELDRAMATKPTDFDNVDTAVDDVCLFAFTSGTTGQPKATMHFHRDVLAMADTVARHVLQTGPNDIYLGSPPLGFTFGLGGLLVFPLRFRGAAALVETPSPDSLLSAADQFRATCLFTAPTMYRAMLASLRQFDISSVRTWVSAGEPLPKPTSDAWFDMTGDRIIDGIGTTEMIHIFISAAGADIRPGSTGKSIPGYHACILDDDNTPLPPDNTGRLAVKGPTGCRYLADDRQRDYVVNGWNVTGDRYRLDADGYFWFVGRSDDMIISAGYNISGPEVESALLAHEAVSECAVVASPDAERGHIVKAFVVLRSGFEPTASLVTELQDFVKQMIAPYKYPRAVEFVDALPKTQTGKIRRFKLREREQAAQR